MSGRDCGSTVSYLQEQAARWNKPMAIVCLPLPGVLLNSLSCMILIPFGTFLCFIFHEDREHVVIVWKHSLSLDLESVIRGGMKMYPLWWHSGEKL